jgi:hypothetical protein
VNSVSAPGTDIWGFLQYANLLFQQTKQRSISQPQGDTQNIASIPPEKYFFILSDMRDTKTGLNAPGPRDKISLDSAVVKCLFVFHATEKDYTEKQSYWQEAFRSMGVKEINFYEPAISPLTDPFK